MALEVLGSILAESLLHDVKGRAHIVQPVSGIFIDPVPAEAPPTISGEFKVVIVLQLIGSSADYPDPFTVAVSIGGRTHRLDEPAFDLLARFPQSWPDGDEDPSARLCVIDLRKSILRTNGPGRIDVNLLLPGGVMHTVPYHILEQSPTR